MSTAPRLRVENIRSLSDFQRHSKSHVRRLRKTGRPEVLTINGRAQIVVQDAESYQRLLELAERAESIDRLQAAIQEAHASKGRPFSDVAAELRAKHLPAKPRKQR